MISLFLGKMLKKFESNCFFIGNHLILPWIVHATQIANVVSNITNPYAQKKTRKHFFQLVTQDVQKIKKMVRYAVVMMFLWQFIFILGRHHLISPHQKRDLYNFNFFIFFFPSDLIVTFMFSFEKYVSLRMIPIWRKFSAFQSIFSPKTQDINCTYIRRSEDAGRLLNVLCTFNLRPVSAELKVISSSDYFQANKKYSNEFSLQCAPGYHKSLNSFFGLRKQHDNKSKFCNNNIARSI